MPVSAGESARAYSTRQLRSTICTGAMRRRLADGKRRNGRTDFGGLFPLFIAGNLPVATIEATLGWWEYSALQNDRPLFKKIGYDFFVYTVMCTRCVNKDFRDDGDRVARYKHFSYLTVTPPSAPLAASLSD